MNISNNYFAYHLAENLNVSLSVLIKTAEKVAVSGNLSQDEAVKLLAKPTNIRSARSLVKLYCSDEELFFDVIK